MIHFDQTLFILLAMSMAIDWIFQTDYEARNKFSSKRVRANHAMKYATGTFILISPFGYFSEVGIFVWAVLFVTHFKIDDRRLVLWIMKKVKGIAEKDMAPLWWMQIAIDQFLHLFVNLLIAIAVYYIPRG